MKNDMNSQDDLNLVVGIVVLNYKNFRETVECVNSLLQQRDIVLRIVIIENGSGNESYDELEKAFGRNNNICIINNDINDGYARGNNIGINYLRSNGIYNIFIANSDLVFTHPYTMRQILDSYEPGVGLINPIICNPNGQIDQRVSYKKRFLYLRMIKKFAQWYIGWNASHNIKKVNNNDIETVKRMVGIQDDRYIVAGSGFMLTRDFLDKYTGLYPGTFLYCEEWATIILLNKAGLQTKVANTDLIIHKGGASTPNSIKTMTKERRKICLNSWRAVFLLAIGLKNADYI